MNRMWEYKKIGEVCTVERGGSPRPIDKFITDSEDGINWIKIGDTDNSMFITKTAQKIIPEGMNKSRYVKPGDFLLSNSMSFGRPYILKIDGCIHDGWLVLRDDNDIFDKRFLYYYLISKPTYEKFKSMAVGGVVNNLNSDMVRKVVVPIIDKQLQSEIANTLDKVKETIDNRKMQLNLLDQFIKSRFVEMFGDFIRKSEHVAFEKICEFVTVGIANSATHAFCDDGVIMFRNQNIKEDYLDTSDIVCITPDFASKYKSKMLKKDDLLIVRTGYPGVACLVPEQYEGCQTFTTLIARLKACDTINPRFICHYINSEYGKKYVKDNSAGAAQQNFGATALSKLPICLPNVELQNEYINFVNHIDKLKVKVQQSLDETQTLFDSLMQQYFG